MSDGDFAELYLTKIPVYYKIIVSVLMKKVSRILLIFLCVAVFCTVAACSDGVPYSPSREIFVVLTDGKHYSVVGDNKKTVAVGDTVSFDVQLDKGYKISGSFGDKCSVSDNISFRQTVTFYDVKYSLSAQLETRALYEYEFTVMYDEQMGNVLVESALGAADTDKYYESDNIGIAATADDEYIFVCWSSGGYIGKGGSLFSYDRVIQSVDFTVAQDLYANFESIANEHRTLLYKMGNGVELEQDCTKELAHHYGANTLTAVDLRQKGIDCDSRYLAGWQTETGEYVGLGSRVAVNGEVCVLTPVWKDYTPTENFTFENGTITGYTRITDEQVVIPNIIDGEAVTVIGENAFANCAAEIFCLPDTVNKVEDDAFFNCTNLTEFYMSDNIGNITDNAFRGCAEFKTLHLNAYSKPKFMTERVAVLGDLYSKLATHADNGVRKVVVLGGSGAQAGYSCSAIEKMFADRGETVEAYNFGWSAAYCGLAQFEVINQYLRDGDIFLHVPEHYNGAMSANTEISPLTGKTGVALTSGAPHLFNFCESNLQLVSALQVNEFTNLFTMLTKFNDNRRGYADNAYSDYCVDTTELGYGYRPNNEQVFHENGVDKYFGSALDILPYAQNFERLNNLMYAKLPAGVTAYVTFPAMNKESLILTYGDQEKAQTATDEYTKRVKEILNGTGIKVLLTQYDVVYDGRYFYNHDYHLGHPTREIHTEKVFAALIETMTSLQRGTDR